MFIRYEPLALLHPEQARPDEEGLAGREFLFFGDLESEYRGVSAEGVWSDLGQEAGSLNRAIWDEAARSLQAGRLAGIFVSLSSPMNDVWS